MKCGTTTLHRTLSQHPDIFATRKKELHYWDYRKLKPIEEYHAYFANGLDYRHPLESTPMYAYLPQVIKRLSRYNKNLKLIYMMRDPVKRALSHLNQNISRGKVPAFDNMLSLEIEMYDMKRLWRKRAWRRKFLMGYYLRGHYCEQMQTILKYFPKNALHYLRLEDLIKNPTTEIKNICDFLEIETFKFDLLHENSRPHETRDQQAIEQLTEYFRPHNQKLHRTFGVQIDDWLN